MNVIRSVVLLITCAVLSSAAAAIDQNEHKLHSSKITPGAAKSTFNSTAAKESMLKMDKHMEVMREMHQKMVNAKTPDERNTLMAEHMKTMQDGMTMMNEMTRPGMDSMGGMKSDMTAHHQMMENHMEMMQTMMQMMMDLLPPASAVK